MIEAISSIQIYNPHGYVYENGNGGVDFPITDSCERSAKVMGEDFVRLVFKLEHRVTFDAFSYIEYNGQTFFLREQYIPTPNGSIQDGSDVSSPYYSYDVKFVSVGNMLDKHVCYRYVKVNGEKTYEWYEPEININGNLETLYVIVMGAIKRIGDEYAANQMHYGTLLQSIAANGLNALGTAPNKDKVKITEGTKLLTFNFSGDNIANVCTTVANNFTNDDNKDTEWYITEEWVGNDKILTMHFAKFVSDAGEQVVSDYIKEDVGNYHFAHPYVTGGLKKVEYAQAWSGITQTIVPYGSDRNMSGQAVKGIDEITQMQSMFGKRLRLDPNTSYNVKDKDGNVVVITTDHNAAIENNYVNTGIEQVKFYDDIYPQGHFKITKVEVKNKRQEGETIPEYTIEAKPIDSNGNDIEAPADGFYPIKIEEGTTLSVRFEKGMLSGREFEIANKTRKDEGKTTYSLKFTIVADGSIEDGTLIPSGNFKPYENDEFALFNMKMPEVYVEQAKQELAQKAYDELVELQTTRPEVKCTTDPVNFAGEMALGNVYRVSSELFNSEHTFVSRVISYSYKLTKTNDIQFSLASSIMQGTLSSMNDMIADVTHATGGLEQRAINLSRRAWRDASEVAEMIDSITTEMMLVGNEKNQFGFTMGIECVDASNKFSYLEIGYGSIQHTQEPYIDYANNGWWEVGTTRLSRDEVGQDLNPDLAYYLYAKVDESTTAQMVLSVDDNSSNEAYLLLGILSSEFEGKRVFSRTNGFTAIEGGTITTEQIQDAGRNLIIDFQSKTPRIIARNGAEIIGNIKFKASDEMTAEEQLAALGIGVSQAQSTADAANTAITAEQATRQAAIAELQKQVAAEEEARTEAIAGLESVQNSLQAQIDGEVTSWFMEGEPTTTNKPASDWTGTDENGVAFDYRQRHEGDTYTDISEITLLTSDMWEQGGLGGNGENSGYLPHLFIRSIDYIENKGGVMYVPANSYITIHYFNNEKVHQSKVSSGYNILLDINYPYYRLIFQLVPAADITPLIADELKLSINPTAGQSWRWCNVDDEYGTGWHWHKIADSDAVKALHEAAKAQATADGKSTIFSLTGSNKPTNYQKGDMWILQSDTIHTAGKKGDILNANADSATYVASHWTKEVKYTDDTAVLNLEIGGRNLASLSIAQKAGYSYEKYTHNGDADYWKFDISTLYSQTNSFNNDMFGLTYKENTQYAISVRGRWLTEVTEGDTSYGVRMYVDYTDGTREYGLFFVYGSDGSWTCITNASKSVKKIGLIYNRHGYYAMKIKIEQGNKVTAWTPAPEDVEAEILAAEQKADKAQQGADKANNQLDAIDNDKVIARSEKATIETQLEQVQAEYSDIVADAGKYSISTSTFESAYNKAVAALHYHCGKTYKNVKPTTNEENGSIPIVTDTTKDYCYSNISAYYSARQTILVAITEAAKAYAEDVAIQQAQNAVDNLEFGGRNLLRNTKVENTDFWEGNGTNISLTDNVIKCSAKDGGYYPRLFNTSLRGQTFEVGATYTLSLWIRSSVAANRTCRIDDGNNTNRIMTFDSLSLTTEWQHIVVSAEALLATTTEKTVFQIWAGVDNPNGTAGKFDTTNWIEVKELKLEKGNKSTGWSPAPEDVDSKADAIKVIADGAAASAKQSNDQLANMSNDSILTPQEKGSVADEWACIQEEYTQNSTNKTAAWGSATVAEWTAYNNAYTTLQTYVSTLALTDRTNNTTIVKSTFQTNFANYYSANVAFLNALSKKVAELEVAAMEVGVRNLWAKKYMMDWNDTYAGTATKGSDEYGEYIAVHETYLYEYIGKNLSYNDILQGKVQFEEGKQYCLKVKWRNPKNNTQWGGLYFIFEYTDGTTSESIICSKNYLTPTISTLITKKGKTVSKVRTTYGSANKTRIYEIQLVQATKQPNDWMVAPEDVDAEIRAAESKAEALGYLTEVLEDSENTTDITGGLVMTNVLMLKDLANAGGSVGAGMSGISADNILLWGGGSYEDAVHAKDNNFEKLNGSAITTLLKKDGTGKIGAFQIDKDTIKVVTDTQTTYITNKSIENAVGLQSTYDKAATKTTDSNSINSREGERKSASYPSGGSKVIHTQTFYNVAAGKYLLTGEFTINSMSVGTTPVDPPSYAYSSLDLQNLYIEVWQNSKRVGYLYGNPNRQIVYEKTYQSEGNEEVLENSDTGYRGGWIQPSNGNASKTITLSAGTITIRAVAEYDAYLETEGLASASYYIDFRYLYHLQGIEKYTVIANDGIAVISNSDSQFYINNDSDSLNVKMRGLPASSTGLVKGDLYTSNGYLRIVT